MIGPLLAVLTLLVGWLAQEEPRLRFEEVAAGLDFPTNIAFAPDGRIFFTEKDTGRIRVIGGGEVLPEPFFELPVIGGGETGLLGIALHPDFPGEPWVYAYYSDANDGWNRLVRIRAEGDVGTDAERLARIVPAVSGYHNGGDLAFGPDGMLYVSTGEAHEPLRAQDPSDPGGKILRITPEGGIPGDNPFGPDSPVYALGIRNSFGLCFDRQSGLLWATDNGPDRDDEINLIEAGGNYGWPIQLGPGGEPDFIDPVLSFGQVIVPTGCAGAAEIDGGLYFGDFRGALHRMLIPGMGADDRTPWEVVVATFDAGITDVAMAPDGALYVVTADAIYRSSPRAGDPAPAGSPAPTPPATGGPTAGPSPEPATGILAGAGIVVLALIVGTLLLVRRARRSGPR